MCCREKLFQAAKNHSRFASRCCLPREGNLSTLRKRKPKMAPWMFLIQLIVGKEVISAERFAMVRGPEMSVQNRMLSRSLAALNIREEHTFLKKTTELNSDDMTKVTGTQLQSALIQVIPTIHSVRHVVEHSE